VANRAGGANVNQLTSSDPNDVEALAGMSWLTGVPVEVEPVAIDSASTAQGIGNAAPSAQSQASALP
jgi:hypothetical protein